MASAAQMEANRKNAQKSTGPKTQKGKATSRLNAVTHGLTARTVLPVQHRSQNDELELADRMSFDPSPGFERYRRHRTALGRELLRTIETLRRLRSDPVPEEIEETGATTIPIHEQAEHDAGEQVATHVQNDPKTAQNEANSLLAQVDIEKETASENGLPSAVKRSHFPEASGSRTRSRCGSSYQVPASSHRPHAFQETPGVAGGD